MSDGSKRFFALLFLGAVATLAAGALVAFLGSTVARPAEGVPQPSDVVFYVLAGATLVCAAGVAFSRSILHSALALLGTLLGTGSLYVYLRADYVAVTQLLIYVGGVLVLILFAVMLTSRISDRRNSNPTANVPAGGVLLAGLAAGLGLLALHAPWRVAAEPLRVDETARPLGDLLLREYLLPFEIASLLLLATLVGSVVVARKELGEDT